MFDQIINNMAQNGVINIPIAKQETGYLSQLYANKIDTQEILSQVLLADEESDELDDAALMNVKVKEPLTNCQNLSYIGELYIGSTDVPQKVRAIFDTGSANPWILSSEGNKDATLNDSYDPDLSSTFTEPADVDKQHVEITFGSGYIKGYFVSDSVLLGDPTDPSNQLVVSDWTFGMVTDHEVFSAKFDALIGLAYPDFAEDGVTPLFDGLMKTRQLADDVFSFYLSQNPDETSVLTFGGWDNERFTGEIVWHDVMDPKLFWTVRLDDVKVGGVSTGLCTKEGANCLVCPDSGTSMATFPPGHFGEFDLEFAVDESCEEGDELLYPDLTYVINGVEYVMPSHHWVTRSINDNDPKGGVCQSVLGELDVGQNGLEEMYILGDIFMQLYYTIHDRTNDRVGFAEAVHSQPEVLMQFDEWGQLASVKTIEVVEDDE